MASFYRLCLAYFVAALAALFLSACSDSATTATNSASLSPFPTLPNHAASPVQLSGKVTDWLFEGDAGCFGTLSDGQRQIEVYAEADRCEPANVRVDTIITVDVVFEADKQLDIGDGQRPSYTIVKFYG